MKWVHSVPAWTLSPRGANPKFQGGVVLGGIGDVSERMEAVQQLSGGSRIKTASGLPLLTSVHLLHELQTLKRKYTNLNNSDAIRFGELVDGIRSGRFPRILAVTAPAFGFPGVENGAILSPYPSMVQMARELHTEAIERAGELKSLGLGEGVVIWWPAFDSRRLDVLGKEPMSFDDAFKRMADFWCDILDATGGTVHLEWKPSDPGIDYLCTLHLAFLFCTRVNRQLGRKAMLINNEWAHLLIGGTTVAEGTRRTIEAGLFTGFVHVNSAQLLGVSVEKLIDEQRVPAENIATGVDWDWAVGMGGKERWDDQQEAVRILDSWNGGETIFAEHDVNPAGQGPLSFAEASINNLESMIAAARG